MVRVARLELAASWSQTMRSTNWATPGCVLIKINAGKRLLLPCRHGESPAPVGFHHYILLALIFLNMAGFEPARRCSASLPSARFLHSRMPCALDVHVYHFHTCSYGGAGFWLSPVPNDFWNFGHHVSIPASTRRSAPPDIGMMFLNPLCNRMACGRLGDLRSVIPSATFTRSGDTEFALRRTKVGHTIATRLSVSFRTPFMWFPL